MKNLLIASTSTLFGEEYLAYLMPELENHFTHCKTILFIPFAQPGGISYDEYTKKVSTAFLKISKNIVGIHQFENKQEAIKQAEGIFVGGGNTFLLVSQLYHYNLLNSLATAIQSGTPYLGCSAGSNITGISMKTTNDMPIVYPPSFETLAAIPFNINPHYLDPDVNSKHNGETRETRIKEFHAFNDTPVIGLREGSWLEVKNQNIILKGTLTARFFRQNQSPIEVTPETNFANFIT